MKTNAEIYLKVKMKDPEFRAQYALSKEKVHLEFVLEKLIEDINKDIDKNIIVKEVEEIVNYVNKIGLD